MLKEIAGSQALKLATACVCPVVAAGVITTQVPQIRKAVHKATAPKHRVKPKVAQRAPSPAADCPPVQPVVLTSSDFPIPTTEPVATPLSEIGQQALSVPPRVPFNPGERASFGPIGGGGGGGGGGVPPPPPTTAPLPEPAAWAFYILGFGTLGGMVRLGRHRRRLKAT